MPRRTRIDPRLNRHQLLAWYDESKRDLPWRRTRDPYAIWVSEIMAQQTQVGTVVPYYLRWMERFPTVQTLADADEHEVLSLWQGLGYYRRAKLLMQGARWVVEHGLPPSASQWLLVPGVGRYTAGAIASIALHEPTPVVDGNVERVYARVLGDASAGPELHRAAWNWASSMVDSQRPGDWNQALMELGATVCTPKNPDCQKCPIAEDCRALREGLVLQLPTAKPKPTQVSLDQVTWVPVVEDTYGLRMITSGRWWRGMWEFPRADKGQESTLADLIGDHDLEPLGVIRHTVTRHRINLHVFLARCKSRTDNLQWFGQNDLETLPLPAPQRQAIELMRRRTTQTQQ